MVRRSHTVDFHAIRHTCWTNLSLAEVLPRVAMELMRHSDLRLTMRIYTDATSLSTAGAVNKLATFGVSGRQESGAEGHNVSQGGADESNEESEKVPNDKDCCHSLTRSGTGCRK